MWIVNAVVVHLLLLGSIFVIYFRSPVLTALRPQKDLTDLGFKPPAKRLVLIVTDGLRAESFFRNNCEDVPHLRNLLLQKGGLVGVSHTRVPTESRPGHIALIAGLYEDPSAVLRGWKENPIDFDTVFNRSRSTYAWGADDVLHIFTRLDDGGKQRLFFEAYDHDLDFSGRNDTYALDEWVFKRVKLLLARKAEQLQTEERAVFFLHLLGLDSAGHIHKPGSTDFLNNLHNTERGIVEIYRNFEDTFPDGKTAYILTSDHGMTDAGSHGAGADYETETPFYLFGSGIANQAPNNGKTFDVADVRLPLHELEQAQMAPLMSALIGVAPPMNNFGKLPLGFMSVDKNYEAAAAHSNALQLLEQFQRLFEEHQQGLFASILRRYKYLDLDNIAAYNAYFEKNLKIGNFDRAIENSQRMMGLALEGIDYYHGYYRNTLLVCTTAAFIGWILYLLQLLITKNQIGSHSRNTHLSTPILFFLGTLVLSYVYMQQVPLTIALYFLVPIFVWMLALQQRFTLKALWYHYKTHKLQLFMLICCAEILVLGFFRRQVISVAFILFAVMNNFPAFSRRDSRFWLWLVLVLCLSVFPLLPPTVGYKNDFLLLIGICWSLLRPFLVKPRISLKVLAVGAVGILNAFYCIYCNKHRLAVPSICLFLSWCYLVYTFAIIALNRLSVLKMRLELIFFSLTAFYNLLCTSYESIFVLMLATELLLSLSAHESTNYTSIAAQSQACMPQNSAQQLQFSFRLAFTILLYTFFSFFGTGNIASVSSFDPNIIRCFLTTFLPFVIMALVILKLIIPVILNICIFYGMSDFARHNERQIFICLLLVCDVMGLNFLFLVKNTGSWLDIGTSISHFVIMEVTTLGLLLLTLPAKLFLKLQTVTPMSLKLK